MVQFWAAKLGAHFPAYARDIKGQFCLPISISPKLNEEGDLGTAKPEEGEEEEVEVKDH